MNTKKILSFILCLAILSGILICPVYARDDLTVFPGKEIGGKTAAVCYDIDGEITTQACTAGREVTLKSEYAMRQFGDRMIVGWQTESGEEYYYDYTDFWRPDGRTSLVLREGETCTLRPIWCPIALRREEVFSFTNSSSVFEADGERTYLTDQHYRRIATNWIATFALSPFAVPAALLGAFFMTVWLNSWQGSCCGFSFATLLQHYGKIDLLSRQGVSNVCELEPDDELISTLNYYNIQAAPCCIAGHVAIQPGTQEYSRQLHALYDTLAGGKPVYFELYGDNPHVIRFILSIPVGILQRHLDISDDLVFHGVVLTGAYTDGNGNHILIMYDNNSMRYADGTCDILYIDPDFTQIYSSYAWSRDDALDGFTWTEEFGQMDSFKIEGVSNPFAWHVRFLKNFPSLMRQIVTYFKTM